MKKRSHTIKIAVAVAAALAVLAGGGTGAWFWAKNGGDPVKVFPLEEVAQTDMWIDNPQFDGNVRAENLQTLYLSSTQQLKEVFVKEGDAVKKGDRLAAFDTTLSDLELDRQKIEVQKLELRLTEKQAELRRVNAMKPYTPPAPAPTPAPSPASTPLEPVELPRLLRGSGTEADPYVYLWNDDCLYDDAFIDTVLPLKEAETETAAAEEEAAPQETEEAEEAADEGTPSPVYEEAAATVVFTVREYDNPKGELLRAWGMTFDRHADGGYSFTVFEPDDSFTEEEAEEPAAPAVTEPEPEQGGYTAADIARMRSEAQQEIKDTETKLKVERLKLKKLELEIDTGVVVASLDGVVKSVATEEAARAEGKPVVTVSAGGAWQVTANVGELDLETLSVGDEAEIQSWMGDGGYYTGRITEISHTPAPGYSGGGSGNPNVSCYPVTVEVDDSAALQEGDYVSVSFSGGGGGGSGLYLEQPFLRTENGRSYVYALGENGRLEKREVGTGKVYWGSTVEIVSGLTMEDSIAFPYGKNVKEGAKTEVSDLSALYEY